MMSKRDVSIIMKLIGESSALESMLKGVDESAFLNNDEKKRATCMTLINIGELIKNLDAGFRKRYDHIPWKDMAGLRDIAAHGYFTLRMRDIWIYASMELPLFAAQIKEILETEEQAP